MALKVCAESGCPELVSRDARDGRCVPHQRTKDKARGTRQQRGYDAAHDRLRARWARRVATGTVACARCGERIGALDEWHLDHTDDRAGYLGPSHALCNVSHAPISDTA